MESYFLNVTLSKYNLLEWSSTDEKQIETDRHRVELFNNSLLSTCDQSDSCFHSALTLLSQGNETVSETSFRLENTFKLFEAFPKTMDLDHYLVFSGVKKMSVFPVFWMKSHISCPQLECFPNDSALEKTNQNLGQRFSTIDYHVLNKEQDLSMRLLTNLNILCRLLDLDSNCGKKESEAKIRSMSPIQQDKFFGEHISQLSSINIATYILALHSQTYDSFMYDIANIPFNKKQSNRMIKKFK
ncbi:hypothetical protein HOG98_05615, partial [bacterium]|nr:hypothetical protein [bacterium]